MKYYFRKPVKRGFSDSVRFAIGASVAWLYRMAFGGFDEVGYRRDRRRFIAEIERNFAYLFSIHPGRIVPQEGKNLPRAFDYVAVTVEFQEIRIRIIRGRGELDAQVASITNPEGWQSFSLVWHRIALPEWRTDEPFEDRDLTALALRFQTCWDRLNAALLADG
jgi:hypothetical protein